LLRQFVGVPAALVVVTVVGQHVSLTKQDKFMLSSLSIRFPSPCPKVSTDNMTQISARVLGGNRLVTFKNNINLKFALFQITNRSLLNQQVLKGVIFIDI
jgi:hypothetical protein